MRGGPWTFHLHVWAWLLIASAGIGYVAVLRQLGPRHNPTGPSVAPRKIASFCAGLVTLAIALTWPTADLSLHWLLVARLFQNVLLFLVAPPLLLLGLPNRLVDMATRPRLVDATLTRITHPALATLIFNCVVIASLIPPVVHAESHWTVAYALAGAVMLGAGTIMWLPVLRLVPGARHMGVAARVGYLFVQSILPNFPALILIFAGHVMYTDFTSAPMALGISARLDQQLAGVAAKVLGITILWCTAGAILMRAQSAEERGEDPDPLTWSDVERELERLDRHPI
ncbi:MAG: cytochrome c oxidase assembly protein [Acidimicrobiales bacterium]